MTNNTLPPNHEFSRRISIKHIQGKPVEKTIEADEAECKALAARFDLPEIKSLTATATLTKDEEHDVFEVTGKLHAEVVQSCVVTLEPVPATLDETFEAAFSEAARPSDDLDVPEPLTDGEIDLGELVAQNLYLSLDPYPKAPGASWPDPEDTTPAGKISPFRDLGKLKN